MKILQSFLRRHFSRNQWWLHEMSAVFPGYADRKAMKRRLNTNHRKIPKVSPGAYILQRPFLRGLYIGGVYMGGLFSEFYGIRFVVNSRSLSSLCCWRRDFDPRLGSDNKTLWCKGAWDEARYRSSFKFSKRIVTLSEREYRDRDGVLGCWPGYVKLYLEVVIKRKSNYWDVRTFLSIVWNVVMSKRDYLEANNAEYCNGDCWILSWQH